jgi:hypothetical protein
MTDFRQILPQQAVLPTILVCLMVLSPTGPAFSADAPVAIVEQTTEGVTEIQAMDLLREGQQLKLGAGDGIIVSYLNSCQRENIRGGLVTIGATESTVESGEVARTSVVCDATALALTSEQVNQSAVTVFRADNTPPEDDIARQARFIMDVRRPVVLAPNAAEVAIVDLRNTLHAWRVPTINGIADLTAERDPLEPGGVYRVKAGARSVTFRIGRDAIDAPAPILRRLIRL